VDNRNKKGRRHQTPRRHLITSAYSLGRLNLGGGALNQPGEVGRHVFGDQAVHCYYDSASHGKNKKKTLNKYSSNKKRPESKRIVPRATASQALLPQSEVRGV
jgi:hypothetical protein